MTDMSKYNTEVDLNRMKDATGADYVSGSRVGDGYLLSICDREGMSVNKMLTLQECMDAKDLEQHIRGIEDEMIDVFNNAKKVH